jgi:glycosyltransferase involved in cell wall biosynthesis
MVRYCLIGPTYPFRGGIAHYTTFLALELLKEHEVLLISFKRQYPGWLYPGESDRDPSQHPLQTQAEYLLDPLNPFSWQQTLQRIKEWKAEVVVIPWWVPFWAPAWAILGRGIKRMPHKPKLLFICHNVQPHEKSIIDKLALQAALSPGDGYIVHSQADADQLLSHFPEAKVRVTPLPTYAALAGSGNYNLPVKIPADRPLLLFCGFVRPYKGLDVLLEAMPRVLAEREVHLLAAGEFWNGTQPYQRQITDLDISKSVTLFDKYLTNEELVACVDAADVVVLPYRSATQSAIVQVAFGRGRPVITTDVGGLPDVVMDGKTGLVVPAGDPEALAAAINRYFGEDLGEKFEANVRNMADYFDWRTLVQALMEIS